jgi:DNA-directed RNA polymerase subunit RPC12/RpoP
MGRFARIAGAKKPEGRKVRARPTPSGVKRRRKTGGGPADQDQPPPPKPPKGAIIADLSRHAPHNSNGSPEYYVDQTRKCRDCGKEFTWTAKRQQYWFEVLKIPIRVQAVRCAACGRKLRLAKEAQKHHMAEMARRPRHPNEGFFKTARPAKKRPST